MTTTQHIGDPTQPVKCIIYVHHDAPVVSPPSSWLTPEEAAQRLGCSRSKVSRLVSSGHLAHRRIGSRVQVHVDEIARFESALSATTSTGSGGRVRSVARAARQAMRLVTPSSSGSGARP